MLYLDNERVDIEGLEKSLGITLPIKGAKTVTFKLNQNLVKLVESDNGEKKVRHKKTVDMPHEFRFTQNGKEHVLAYTTNHPQLKDGRRIYTDPKPVLKTPTQLVNSADLEKAAFMFCHPFSANSPFEFAKKYPKKWHLEDKEAEARQKNESRKAKVDIDNLIYGGGLNEKELRTLFMGLGLNSGFIDKTEHIGIETIKDALYQRAEANPAKFLVDKDKMSTGVRATIQQAIDRGVVQLVTENRVKKWKLQGNTIADVPDTVTDAMDTLLSVAASNHKDIMVPIQNAMKGETLEDKFVDNSYEDLVSWLEDNNKIDFRDMAWYKGDEKLIDVQEDKVAELVSAMKENGKLYNRLRMSKMGSKS